MQHPPNRYVDEQDQVRNFYQSGRNLRGKIDGAREVADYQKNRFVFVLAPRESKQYELWRAALPDWITDLESQIWLQPRLLLQTKILSVVERLQEKVWNKVMCKSW